MVFEAVSIKTGQRVAIKCMKKKFESVDKVRRLKEIQALTALAHHENIVKLIEVLFDEPTGVHALMQASWLSSSNSWK